MEIIVQEPCLVTVELTELTELNESGSSPVTLLVASCIVCVDRTLDYGALSRDSPTTTISDNDDRTFDPRAPRSSYSLYPLEYLLYCEDCQQIRCPRCVTEETVTYFCPNCLFEVPSSNLRSEGTRCTRSCYQCPNCIGPVQVVAVPNASETKLLGPDGASTTSTGPFALICQYCNWSSREIGIEFDRHSGIHSQLSRVNNGGEPKITAKEVKERRKETHDDTPLPDDVVDADLQFANLKSFYQSQLADVSSALGGLSTHDGGFSSPAALSRIMSLYTGRGGQKSQQGVPYVMREALNTDEGLKLAQLNDSSSIKKLTTGGWECTVGAEQKENQLEGIQFQDELRPIPYLLRTKRSKRCPACRHILSKPENKVTSTRYKIRLVARSYIPTTTIRPLQPTSNPIPVTYRPGISEEGLLKPSRPYQYILTFKNPLFENIKVSLATPNVTPGRFASIVTVLCPQFEIDANTDMWDDALKDDGRDRTDGSNQVEVGKIWERGRNWVSIILEVVPASLVSDPSKLPLKEGEDILEIPMFVRMEWESDVQNDMGTSLGKERDAREKRELAYWCVLGVGKIARQ
ncbi:dynactin Arp1 p62 subunit [Cordyceps militaris]|uniref:Dynactin subunit 4 n=1 Tax=Cordyceps militaris TaxID=73501 RepID=A0A2H4SCI5_CORMI|nr:dynactin Arp1 p62 subunit [Cordyceps militaris]